MSDQFPRTILTSDGDQIVITNEICDCAHFRTQHLPKTGPAIGKGACRIEGCRCEQFYWRGNTLGGMSAKADQFIAHINIPEPDFGEFEQRIIELEEDLASERSSLASSDKENDGLTKRNKDLDKIVSQLEDKLVETQAAVRELQARLVFTADNLSQFTSRLYVVRAGRRSIIIDDDRPTEEFLFDHKDFPF